MNLNLIRFLCTKSPKNNFSSIKLPVYFSEVRQNLPALPGIQKKYVIDKITDLNKKYTRLIGLDEVNAHHDRVIKLQEQLQKAQENRRKVAQDLQDVRLEGHALQERLPKMNRSDPEFINVLKADVEVLKKEKVITNELQECERYERDVFTALTNAIRDSHEKQRAQIEYTKYFGKKDLQRFIDERLGGLNLNNDLFLRLENSKKDFEMLVEKIDFLSGKFDQISLSERVDEVQNERNSEFRSDLNYSDLGSYNFKKIVFYGIIGGVVFKILFS